VTKKTDWRTYIVKRCLKMKKSKYVFIGVLIGLFALAGLRLSVSPIMSTENAGLPITIFYNEPQNVTITRGEATLSSKLTNLTIPMLINDSDLVAVVKITSTGKYYSKYPKLPFTLYEGEIQKIIKGVQENSEITLLIYGGYVREDWFARIETEPDFKQDSTWLLFLDEREYEDTFELKLPDNTYRPKPPTSLMIIDNKLVKPIEDYNIYLPKIKLSNTPIDEFISEYGSP